MKKLIFIEVSKLCRNLYDCGQTLTDFSPILKDFGQNLGYYDKHSYQKLMSKSRRFLLKSKRFWSNLKRFSSWSKYHRFFRGSRRRWLKSGAHIKDFSPDLKYFGTYLEISTILVQISLRSLEILKILVQFSKIVVQVWNILILSDISQLNIKTGERRCQDTNHIRKNPSPHPPKSKFSLKSRLFIAHFFNFLGR